MWIPQNSVNLGYYYLDLIEKNFNSDDVFIGINRGTDINFIEVVKNKFKNVKEVEPELHINSDASGYQAALSILNKDYDFLVFGHTKGASYDSLNRSEFYRNLNKKVFWDNTDNLIGELKNNKKYGIIGYAYMSDGIGPGMPDFSGILRNFCDLKYEPILGFYANSFYIIKGEVISFFLKNQNNFFKKNLIDRYFFESFFPKIPSMMGYDMISVKETENNNMAYINIIESKIY